jgi:hypothetical protein
MRVLVITLALLPLACGKEQTPTTNPVATSKVADPGPGIPVKQAKEKGPGEEVIVEGRVSNIVKGVAAFNLIDASLDYCGQKDREDSCKTPWDYCCIANDERAAATVSVEKRGPDGKVLAAGAGDLPAIRLLDLVAVKGKIEKDEHGNVTIVETVRFVRERPNLPEDVHWPE